MPWGRSTNLTGLDQFSKPIEREGQISVRLYSAVVEGVALLADSQRFDRCRRRDIAQGPVTATDRFIKRGLSWCGEARRGHQCDSRVRKRLGESSTRPPINPAIWIRLHEQAILELQIRKPGHLPLNSAHRTCACALHALATSQASPAKTLILLSEGLVSLSDDHGVPQRPGTNRIRGSARQRLRLCEIHAPDLEFL